MRAAIAAAAEILEAVKLAAVELRAGREDRPRAAIAGSCSKDIK